MFNQFTYRQKFVGVILLTILFLFGAYKLTFKKTFELKSKVEKKEYLIQNLGTIQDEIRNYKLVLENQNINVAADANTLQNLLYEKVAKFCNNSPDQMTIKKFDEPHTFHVENKSIQTCSFAVGGGYKALLQLNQMLERDMKFAQLAGVEYELIEKQRNKELIATFYVQNVYEI